VDARLADVLRSRNVALALVDHAWMPWPTEVFEKLDPVTADFAYIRWLGDRKGIEKRTKRWDRTIVDRSAELGEWVEVRNKIAGRGFFRNSGEHAQFRLTVRARKTWVQMLLNTGQSDRCYCLA
jgi:hypothetical protein